MSLPQTVHRYFGQLGAWLIKTKLRVHQDRYSNFDEERIIKRFADELLPGQGPRTAVDLGAGDGIKGSNTYALFRGGWRGLGVEAAPHRARRLEHAYRGLEGVTACHAQVTPSNVEELLKSHGVNPGFDLLSLDIDSYDYWVLERLLESFRPLLVVTEINEKIPPPICFVVRFDPYFRPQHHFFGYSIASLEGLCARHGYALIELEYNNAFLARLELKGVCPLDFTEAYQRGYLDRADRHERFHRNRDMEALHMLSPAEGVEFIRRFFARHEDKYDVSLTEIPDSERARYDYRGRDCNGVAELGRMINS